MEIDKITNTSIRKVVTVLFTITFCYLSITGVIKPEPFIDLFKLIIIFYFLRKRKEEGNV